MSSPPSIELTSSVELFDAPRWYALHVRAKHEKRISKELREKHIETFLPAAKQVHRWSDRRVVIEMPLFPCYVFVRMHLTSTPRWSVLRTPGVFRFVGFKQGPTPIPNVEIESVQAVIANRLPLSSCGFVKIGQKVRIRGGALEGVEGVLIGHDGARRLVISIHLIQQSMAVPIEGYDIEPV